MLFHKFTNYYSPIGTEGNNLSEPEQELVVPNPKTNSEIYLSLLGGVTPTKKKVLYSKKGLVFEMLMLNETIFYAAGIPIDEIASAIDDQKPTFMLDGHEVYDEDNIISATHFPCWTIQNNRFTIWDTSMHSGSEEFKAFITINVDAEYIFNNPKLQPKTRSEYWLAKLADVPITRKRIIFDRVVEVPDSIDTDNETYAFVAIPMYDSVNDLTEIITNWAIANNLDPNDVMHNLGDENFEISFNSDIDGMTVRISDIPSEEPGGEEAFGLIIEYGPKTGFDISNFPAVGTKIEVKMVYYIPVELVPRTRHERFMQAIYDYKTNDSSDSGTDGKPDDPINGGKT